MNSIDSRNSIEEARIVFWDLAMKGLFIGMYSLKGVFV